MTRSRLWNNFLKNNTEANQTAYRKQKKVLFSPIHIEKETWISRKLLIANSFGKLSNRSFAIIQKNMIKKHL